MQVTLPMLDFLQTWQDSTISVSRVCVSYSYTNLQASMRLLSCFVSLFVWNQKSTRVPGTSFADDFPIFEHWKIGVQTFYFSRRFSKAIYAQVERLKNFQCLSMNHSLPWRKVRQIPILCQKYGRQMPGLGAWNEFPNAQAAFKESSNKV